MTKRSTSAFGPVDLTWALSRSSTGTAGSFLKSYEVLLRLQLSESSPGLKYITET